MNEVNLRKLAYGLWNPPEGMPRFNMKDYEDYCGDHPSDCGTAGCAVGWASLLVCKKRPREAWGDFAMRIFDVDTQSDLGYWLFGGGWRGFDNTPEGAAKRILWMLQFGLPEDIYKARKTAPLCYASWEIVNESDTLDGSGLRLLDVSQAPAEPEIARRDGRRVLELRDGLSRNAVGDRAAASACAEP